MGKANRRSRGKNRANPIAKTVKPPTDPELIAIRDKQILPVIANLTSIDLNKRSEAAQAIANLIEDAKCRKLLLREQLVRILLEQTITDSSMQSKSAGWGILRNLALEEEADFCIHLYRQDILTAIDSAEQSLIETLESKSQPFSELPAAQKEHFWTLATSIVSLISSLGEAQEEILQTITKSKSIEFLFRLCYSDIPDQAMDEVLLCLNALTEDNPELANKIVEQPDFFNPISDLKSRGGIKAVAACGILHNLFEALDWYDHNTPKEGASDAALLPVLMECMDQAAKNHGTANGHGPSSPDQVLQMALDITAAIATSLQEALEHGNSHEEEFKGFGDDEKADPDAMMEDGSDVEDDDEEKEGDDDEEEDEMTAEEMEADMARVLGDDGSDDEAPADSATLSLLVRKVAPSILPYTQAGGNDPSGEAIRNAALSALNNIAWTLSSIDFSDEQNAALQSAWQPAAQQIWAEVIHPVLESNTADISLAALITSLAWAIARSLQGQVGLKGEEHKKFMALYQASRSLPADATDSGDAFQGLGVKCIGVLGRLALNPAPIDINREIGVFLLTVLAGTPEPPAADAVEILDQIFDIYADKSYACDQVYWNDGFHKHLEEVAPKLRKMIKTIDKRKMPELRARADEALLNLTRFLKYKKTEQK